MESTADFEQDSRVKMPNSYMPPEAAPKPRDEHACRRRRRRVHVSLERHSMRREVGCDMQNASHLSLTLFTWCAMQADNLLGQNSSKNTNKHAPLQTNVN